MWSDPSVRMSSVQTGSSRSKLSVPRTFDFPATVAGVITTLAITAALLATGPRSAYGQAVQVTAAAAQNLPGQQTAAATDRREPITWDHVFGINRISVGGSSPVRYTWISDDDYIVRESSGWKRIVARTGESASWYDETRLAEKLQMVEGVSPADAKSMASGAWKHVLHELRIVVFERADSLIRISLDGEQLAVVKGIPSGAELASLSPTGSAVAFIHQNELWSASFQTGEVRRLTHDASEHVRNGKADWVYFEEVYSRKWDAFRWSPDGTKLLFQQFDDTHVPQFSVTDQTLVQPVTEVEHFPKAGENNPLVRLGIVSCDGGPVTWVNTDHWSPTDLIISYFDWLPNSSAVYWYAQNRVQSWLDVVQSDVSDGRSAALLRDQTGAWVDNPGALTVLKDGSFLMFSERTGWRHLYRVSADGQTCTPVTSGDWEVRWLLSVNEDQQFAIVAGTRDSHIAENLYRVSLKPESHEVLRLSPEDGHHSANVSLRGGMFVDSWSSLQQPTAIVLRDALGNEVKRLHEPVAVPHDEYRFGKVELRDLPMADGSKTAAIFVLPPDFDETKTYPVWLMTYGGPHYPGVKNAFSGRLMEQLLANLGIVVIRFDPRSASGYGAKSAWLAYKQLGVEETRDLVSVCDWLDNQSWVDETRIGMSGHSYGGYFTSYAMTHCKKLCAGIAGAPVTDWANYDTIYTERFMLTPQENPDGYRKSSVVNAASSLHGRLLLLHGLMDDNVHPSNSLQLMHQLQRSNRQFEVMFYPTARHGLFGSHYEKLTFNFIVEAMGKPDAIRR